jgi:glycosyltransferase involved in cell wall biosynthesis
MPEVPDTLVLYTQAFPGNGEPYLENEVNILAEKFKKIYIVPASGFNQMVYSVPVNVEIFDLKGLHSSKSNRSLFIKHVMLILTVFFKEFMYSGKRKVLLSHFREFNSYLLNSLQLSLKMEQFISEKKLQGAVHYSFWMNGSALALALLKFRQKIKAFVFRTNGFDLYENQTRYGYIPFKPFIFSQASRMFAVSKKGADHMKETGVNTSNITYSYFGTSDHGVSVFDPAEKFTILTCSDLRRIKRADKMVDVLNHLNFPVRWIHHGDKGDNQEVFYEKIKQLGSHVEFELHERKKNYDEVLKFFKDHHFNLFMLLSSTEGVPVTLLEAMSFGIPIMATDVGGVSEVINASNGILLEKEFDVADVAKKISDFSRSEMNSSGFRKGVRADWEQRFSATSNYNKFYNEIIS